MSKHVVVIGAVALGPKAACRFKRLEPGSRVTLIDQAPRISYGGCGIPYFVSGEVNSVTDLQSTPYHIVRDAAFFKTNKDVDVLTNTRATKVNRADKTVEIVDVLTGKTDTLHYDKLVLAMGSKANLPPFEGINLSGISAATNLDEAEMLRNAVAAGQVNSAVIVGAGFIGLEMAVAFADMWGIETTVVELQDQVLPNFLSKSMATMAQHDLEEKGVTVLLGESVQRFEGEDGAVARVVTNKRTIEADLVVLAAGVSPNTGLAKEAGIECDPRGAIIVDEYMRTNDPDIYSGGDCVTIPNLVTGKRGYYPLGSMANRQGRVIGTNLAGGKDTFPGAVGGWVVKLFDQSACGAGLTIENAVKEGFDAISVHVEQFDRAHFFPEKALMSLELVVDKPTRRVLGIQGMSELGDALTARINAVVPLLKAHSTIEEVSNLEVVYSPPFASAMDIVNALGNVTENVLEGRNHMMTPAEFAKAWGNCDTDEMCFIDTRLSGNAQPLVEKYPGRWHNIPNEEIRARINEVPADKPIVVICNTGLRSYEAMLLLNELGRGDVKSAAGGMVAQKKIGSAI
jgi:NADPH-dependent 2,4-dienoyl-CoA reductase/sulfur reductase-like enzyme/rhodanese-related sulfurtransferase